MRAATRTLHATLNTNAAAATAYLVVQRAQRDLNTDVSPFQRPRAMLAGQSARLGVSCAQVNAVNDNNE